MYIGAGFVLEGRTLAAIIGVCFLLLGGAAFVWGQWAWERHPIFGRFLLLLISAFLIVLGFMFLGAVAYIERTWGI